LKQSAINSRWDSTIFNALLNHASKQGLAEAVVNQAEWERENARRLGGFKSEYPDAVKAREIVAAAKERLLKREKDKLKQNALYVSIFKDGRINNLPNEITKDDTEGCLLFTEKFQDHVALLLGDRGALERFFKT
jgi:AbiV family abortive infection protein